MLRSPVLALAAERPHSSEVRWLRRPWPPRPRRAPWSWTTTVHRAVRTLGNPDPPVPHAARAYPTHLALRAGGRTIAFYGP